MYIIVQQRRPLYLFETISALAGLAACATFISLKKGFFLFFPYTNDKIAQRRRYHFCDPKQILATWILFSIIIHFKILVHFWKKRHFLYISTLWCPLCLFQIHTSYDTYKVLYIAKKMIYNSLFLTFLTFFGNLFYNTNSITCSKVGVHKLIISYLPI